MAKTFSQVILWLLFLLLLACVFVHFYFAVPLCVLFSKGDLAVLPSQRRRARVGVAEAPEEEEAGGAQRRAEGTFRAGEGRTGGVGWTPSELALISAEGG